MQPQLFVTPNWNHLLDVLEEFADGMGFRQGGSESLKQAVASQNVATVVYSSGLQVSGKITRVTNGSGNHPVYIQTNGPTSLACNDKQLEGHGINYHSEGFGSPVGRLKNINKPLEKFTGSDLRENGITEGRDVSLIFGSGITVQGRVKKITRKDGAILLISFNNCRVNSHNGEILFQPDWGVYDMAVGENIISVFSGSADKEKHNVLPDKSDMKAIDVSYDQSTRQLFSLYQNVREIREDGTANTALKPVYEKLRERYPDEWLLRLELLEQIQDNSRYAELASNIQSDLQKLQTRSEEQRQLITSGVELIN
jgi:phenylalanine-4-hydroxylase